MRLCRRGSRRTGRPRGRRRLGPSQLPGQTVPERMLIISAGVILNTITAFLFAIGAYLLGTDFLAAKVYESLPAVPPGNKTFAAATLSLAHRRRALAPALGRRPPRVMLWPISTRASRPRSRTRRQRFRPRPPPASRPPHRPPTIGVLPPQLTTLARLARATPENPDKIPAYYGSPAFAATPKFAGGDEIVSIAGEPIKDYADVIRAETLHAGETVAVVVRRRDPPADANAVHLAALHCERTHDPDAPCAAPRARARDGVRTRLRRARQLPG